MSVAEPWLLLLLLGALLPLLRHGQYAQAHPALELLPPDPLSTALAVVLRLLGAVAVAAIVVGLARPSLPETAVERIGRGAEIVLLLDRSRSMDQAFVSRTDAGNFTDGRREAKGRMARRVLAEFAASRGDDRLAMIAFSTLPLPILDFTRHQEVIQAAIAAGEVGRGLGETDIGRGLEAALGLFVGRPYAGSRIILMVSDGGAHIDPDTRERIGRQMRRQRVALYWIYIRSFRSPGLMAERNEPPENAETVPEYFLHQYFKSIGIPYRAYEAENPADLKRAIADVDRLESLPIATTDTLPRRDLSQHCFAVALACLVLLLGARLLEVRR
jgi:mxaC protein